MPERLSYRGLKCPHCRYSLEGLSEPICPECGCAFSPDWLYSADYEYAINWTRRRKVIAWSIGVLPLGAIIYLAASVGSAFLFMIFVVACWGGRCISPARRCCEKHVRGDRPA